MYSSGIFFAALQQGEDRVVISSSRGSQRSCYRRDGSLSIFTQHLLEALAGMASQPGDTVVPVTRLFGYLSQQVPRSARNEYQAEQTPWCELAAEDFPVALLLGGKGLAALASGRPALARLDTATVRARLRQLLPAELEALRLDYFPLVGESFVPGWTTTLGSTSSSPTCSMLQETLLFPARPAAASPRQDGRERNREGQSPSHSHF